MPTPFRLRTELLDPPDALVSVTGELDLGTAGELKEAVAELMGTGRRHIIVDMAMTEFIDSSGIGVLFWAARRLRAVGGDLVAVNVRGAIDRTFALAHIDDVIAVERAKAI